FERARFNDSPRPCDSRARSGAALLWVPTWDTASLGWQIRARGTDSLAALQSPGCATVNGLPGIDVFMNRRYLRRMRLLGIFVSLCMAMPIWARMAQAPENMSFIPGGRTQMGIDRDEVLRFQEVFRIKNPQLFEDEIPKHTVELDSFYIDKQLVTNAQFKE